MIESNLTDQTIERDGIMYFKQPYRVDCGEWIYSHLDCDSIIQPQEVFSEIIDVLCYAKSKEYNKKLKDVRAKEFPADEILGGVGAEEVNLID